MRKIRTNGPFMAALLLCFSLRPGHADTLVIGSKDFTEQRLIAEMTHQVLSGKGIETELRTGLSSPGLRTEQEAGLIDLYWEYTGTSLAIFNNAPGPAGPEEGYARVRELDAAKGLLWLSPSRVDDTYALAMRRSDAERLRLKTVSDLATQSRSGRRFRIAVNTEFFIRTDGLQPLQRAYHFEFALGDVVRTPAADIYETLRSNHSIDVGLVFSTDGRNAAYDFVLLADDRRFFPAYILAPVIRKQSLAARPAIAGYLKPLADVLDNATMSSLNAKVDVAKQPVAQVASEFLATAGLGGGTKTRD